MDLAQINPLLPDGSLPAHHALVTELHAAPLGSADDKVQGCEGPFFLSFFFFWDEGLPELSGHRAVAAALKTMFRAVRALLFLVPFGEVCCRGKRAGCLELVDRP